MRARRILQLGDPILRMRSTEVRDFAAAKLILDDLRATLREFQRTHGFGRGISAVQIGEPKRLIYLEFSGRQYSLINPEFEWKSPEKFRMWDDCFSFPDLMVWLERSRSVRVTYTDEAGKTISLEAVGPLSELLQHEMDHLDGILAVDHAIGSLGLCTREEWERQGRPGVVAHLLPPLATRADAGASK
jgi:peptide deformylase